MLFYKLLSQMQCKKDKSSPAVWLFDHREALTVLVWNKNLQHAQITFIHPSQITVWIYGSPLYFLLLSFFVSLLPPCPLILPPHHTEWVLWKSRRSLHTHSQQHISSIVFFWWHVLYLSSDLHHTDSCTYGHLEWLPSMETCWVLSSSTGAGGG